VRRFGRGTLIGLCAIAASGPTACQKSDSDTERAADTDASRPAADASEHAGPDAAGRGDAGGADAAMGGAGGTGGAPGGSGGSSGAAGGSGGFGGGGTSGGSGGFGAGGSGGSGGFGPGGSGGGSPALYDYLLIVDSSEEENRSGTPGADVCGVSAICNGVEIVATTAALAPGTGSICMAGDPMCATDRANPDAALDDGVACDDASVPSDYVSLGMGGVLTVGFAQDLRGCEVDVIENPRGATRESYFVLVCADRFGDNCLEGQPLIEVAHGGNAAFDVPF
jgi:hypothetical protein